jgi:hypothetical protein
MIRSLPLLAVLVAMLTAPTVAQSPAPEVTQSPNFGSDDVRMLLKAVHCELTPQCSQVHVQSVPASRMPSYDPVVHYVGLGSDPHVAILWVNKAASGASLQKALFDGMLLACMDDGEAGPKWKSLYDLAAAADARLPSDAAGPYLNRHKLAQSVDDIVDSH